ncbi:MAG: hypothetical protein JXN59_13990 [Anaerolineae bacterium]|nr:hypothetical protein [Anaerolineae bacterium]
MKGSLGKISAVVGLFMIIASMLLTTILPGGSPRQSQPTTAPQMLQEPTIPPVIFPTPNPGGPDLIIGTMAAHPSGTFVIAQPQGFTPATSANDTIHSMGLVDTARYSVIHAYIQTLAEPQDVASLDRYNSPETLAATWSEYGNWVETDRRVTNDRLIIDFTLSLDNNYYLARQVTWAVEEAPTLVVVVRLVVPDNNPALLAALEDLIIPSYHLLPGAATVPLSWGGAVDTVGGYVMRFPPEWTRVDAAAGRIATLTGPDDETLTLNSETGHVTSAEDAATWVMENRSGAEILASEPVSRADGEGFAVAYAFATADGEPQSGLALLLNGPSERLVNANLRLDRPDVNLLDARADHAALWAVLDTFSPLPAEAVLPPAAGAGS